MSDTDNTDDLLLIPPDFFVIDSDTSPSNIVGPYYNIVDNLIQQVNGLQHRIKSIESSSDFLSNSLDFCLDHSHAMQNIEEFRKYNSIDDLYVPNSTQSTPQKPHTKFKMNSLPGSPNTDRFTEPNTKIRREFKAPSKLSLSPKSTKRSPSIRSKEEGRMLGEIDTFLSKVKTIQRLNTVRNLETDFTHSESKNSQEVDRLVEDFKRQQKKLESRMEPQNSTLNVEPIAVRDSTWQSGDNKESVPDYGTGFRDSLYNEPNKPTDDYKTQIKPNSGNNSYTSLDKYPQSDSSTDITQITAYNEYSKSRSDLLSSPLHFNALNVLNKHKQLLEDSDKRVSGKSKGREHKPRGTNTINDNLGLMSLADIWSRGSEPHENPAQVLQKLQEERLRRQHCENLIQELQNRNLEFQQRLSVALKVDDSKNNTIYQFQEALQKIFAKLEKNNKEKLDWENEVSRLKAQHSRELEEATQKSAYYEKEASKALNLAHGNQEKLSSLERRCSDLQHALQSLEAKFQDVQDNYARERERNKKLSDVLSQKEIELSENKHLLNDARTEVSQTKRAVELCQAEFTAMKDECMKSQTDLRNERAQITQLNEQKRKLLKDVESHKYREIEMKDELEQARKQLDTNKVELRNFYQGQVEILVQNKLKEFQNQLDQAENTFKDEIKKREMSIAKTAASHIQQISEKYSLEIQLLEKKHQEESKLYQIQIMQYKQQLESLQSKVDQMHEKRVLIVKQLQKIMESQWSEALRIISSGKSPAFNDDHFSTIDQLNSLKSKSYNNLEEVLAQQPEEAFNVARKNRNEMNFLAQNEGSVSSLDKNVPDAFNVPMETPVSSRPQGSKHFNENEIQKYVSLLLNRPPGNPTHEVQKDTDTHLPENVDERGAWQPLVRPRRPK